MVLDPLKSFLHFPYLESFPPHLIGQASAFLQPGWRVTKAINNLKIVKPSCLIVMASGNDLFLQKSRTSYTEPIMSMFGEMIGKVREKSDKCIIGRLIPGMHLSREMHSKVIVTNRRLARLCRTKNV
jgi:hypothetical protein